MRRMAFSCVAAVTIEKFLEFLPPPTKWQLHLNPLSIKVLTIGLVCIIQDNSNFISYITVGSSEISDTA